MILLRSLLFQAYFYGSVVFFASLVVIFAWMPYRFIYRFAKGFGVGMMWVGKHLCGLDYVIEGRENIPDEASVVLIKHSTVFETYAQLAVFPPQTWVLKKELLWVPFFGLGLKGLKAIAIDRKSGHRAVGQVIQQGKERLKDGIWVCVFPEGTRVPAGKTRKYGISGAALAHEAGVPVVPVAHNAGDLWARRGIRKYPGVIRFVIGPPIDGAAQSPKETNALAQAWIEEKMAELSPAAYADTDGASAEDAA